MANYTENYDLVKPTMAETADIRTINGNMDTVDAIMHDTQVSMADAFDSTKSYAIREKCMYEFKLYQCIHPHTGPWDAEDFERVNAADTGGNYVEITPTYQSGLKIADTNIDGDLDEIDVPYFGGATAQENGTGGAVPAPTSSDVGKFLSSNGGWETPSGGGGGTTVVPNPVGEPTDELETVRIGDTIFSIPGSGGGAGGSALTDDVIYEDTTGATGVQNITLTERLDKYDALYFEFYFPSETTYINANPSPLHRIVETPTGASNKYFVQSYPSYGNRYILLESTDGGTGAKITTSSWGDAIYPSIYRIHGVIFGGGKGYDSTLLWDYVDDNNGTILYGTYTETLRDDINNYNVIILEFASARTDLTNVNWDSTVFVTLDVEALNNAWNPNKTNITSFGERSSRFYIHDNVLQKTIDIQGDTNGLVRVYGVKFGGGSGSSEEISDMTWTELVSTTGTSTAVAIPQGTKKLVLTAQLGGIVTKVAEESMANIQKLLDVSLETTWNMGGEYADTAGNHTNVAMSVTNGLVTARSGYNTVTAKVYALS